jgi:uncharacterized phiE125 gp8 family phage protein
VTFEIVTAPSGVVISLTDAKNFMNVSLSDTSQDTLIQMMIDSAVEQCERYSNKILRSTKFKATYQGNLAVYSIHLTKNPITEISLVKTDDAEDIDYKLIQASSYPVLSFEYDYKKIECTFTAGYITIPASLKMAILQHTLFLFENRGDCSKPIPDYILKAYRLFGGIML